ncbi:MAG: GTPase, partial [Nitrososphaeraceae archaeon]|nr:GTPase [Nitrososphaeraceae archaeon]
ITKSDLINEKLKYILRWSTSNVALESALSDEKDAESSLLSKDLLRAISKGGFIQSPVAISSVTMNGMVNLVATLSRILNLGEETKD